MMDLDQQVATILFLLYVRVVDIDKSIGLRDIEKFDQLIDQPQLLNLPLLSSSIEKLRTNYSQLWKNYRKGILGQENEEISKSLEALDFQKKTDDWLEWRDALLKFVQYFAIDHGLARKLGSQLDLRKNRMDQVGSITLLIMNWKPVFAKNLPTQDFNQLETTEVLLEISQSIRNILQKVHLVNNSNEPGRGVNQHLTCIDVRQ
jgi:hypothetical protein